MSGTTSRRSAGIVSERVAIPSRGAPVDEDFRLEEGPLPTPGDGEVLVRVHYMSLDPYMRGRMDDAKS